MGFDQATLAMKKHHKSLVGKIFVTLIILLAALNGWAGNLTIDTVPDWQIGTGNTEYVCVGKGDTVVFTVNDTVNDGGSVGNYVWNVGNATILSGGNGSNTVTLAFGNATNGSANTVSLAMQHTDPNNGIVCTSNASTLDFVTVEVIKLDVMNVSYGGDAGTTNVRITDAGTTAKSITGNIIPSPEWVAGGNNNPACYVQGTSPELTVNFSISPNITASNITANATITGLLQVWNGTVGSSTNLGNLDLEDDQEETVNLVGNVVCVTLDTDDTMPSGVYQGNFNGTFLYGIGDGNMDIPMATNPQTGLFSIYGQPGGLCVETLERLKYWCNRLTNTTTVTASQVATAVGQTAVCNDLFNGTNNIISTSTDPNEDVWGVIDGNLSDCITLATLMQSSLSLLGVPLGANDTVVCVYPSHADWSHLVSTSSVANEYDTVGGTSYKLIYVENTGDLDGNGNPVWAGNNFEGCFRYQGTYWMGGVYSEGNKSLGLSETDPKQVLADVCINTNVTTDHQTYSTLNPNTSYVTKPSP
jgi:hypothetical protein